MKIVDTFDEPYRRLDSSIAQLESPGGCAELMMPRLRSAGVALQVVLILATQRREYQLAQLREQLTLELAILSEQKTAKVIQLLEESRRDNPLIRDRVDQEAEAMAQPADPQSVLDAIKETHAEAEQISGPTDGA